MPNEATVASPSRNRILFVDLDGTLVNTDVLWEAFMRAVKQQPWILLIAPFWLLKGRAGLKRAISERSQPDPTALPYNQDVVDFIEARRSEGSRVVLATASDRTWADQVAAHTELFDDVLASDGSRNLKGNEKLAAIVEYCETHGANAWGYMGDSSADLPIWAKADEVHMVAPSSTTLAKVRSRGEPDRVFGKRPSRLRPAIKAMRPHQWVKNSLLFVPLLLARAFTPEKLVAAIAAFFAFSFCASSVYLVNDLLDIEADRHHPRKRKRPFAAGTLPIMYGPPMAVMVLAAGLGIAAVFLPLDFLGVLLLYMVVTSAYSAILKSKLMIDVLILAGLYTLRIFAGGVATDLPVSEWLLAFSIFMFTSLAFAKRYIEMLRLASEGKTSAKGRGYQTSDISLIESVGPTAGYLAVLVFALYINSDGLPIYYTNKHMLWLTCPLMLYWITRLWFLAKRGQLHDDPVVFAVTDKVSLGIGALVGLLTLLAAPIW